MSWHRHLYFRSSRKTENENFKTHLKIQEDIDSKKKKKGKNNDPNKVKP